MLQKEFLEIEGGLVATPRKDEEGGIEGWVLSINGIYLKRNRGGIRSFKMKGSVDKFCTENGIESYTTKGL